MSGFRMMGGRDAAVRKTVAEHIAPGRVKRQ
jgi:hypothetical protein